MKRTLNFSEFFAVMVLAFVFLGGCHLKAEKHPASQSPAIQSKGGPISEQDLGVPLYPHGNVDQNQSFAIQGNSSGKKPVTTTSASLSTPDSVEQVLRFYQEKLGNSARITEHESASGKLVDIFVQRREGQIRMQIVPRANGTGSIIVILTQFRKI